MKSIHRSFIFLLLALCLLAGCSKKTSEPGSGQTIDAGVVDLVLEKETRHNLPDGKVLVLTANPLVMPNMEVIANLEKAGHTFKGQRIKPTMSDLPLKFIFDDITITVTPHVAQ